MITTFEFYSSGKKRPGGYSGMTVFTGETSNGISIEFCFAGVAAVAAQHYKLAIVHLQLFEHIRFEYVAYSDSFIYEKIKAIYESNLKDKQKANKLYKLIISVIDFSKVNIIDILKECYNTGINQGMKLKQQELINVLGL